MTALAVCALAGGGMAGSARAQAVKGMAAPAATPTQFALFSEFCLSHPADYQGLIAALKARGFPESNQLIRSDAPDTQATSFAARVNGVDYLIALAWTPPDGVKSTRASTLCAVMQAGQDPASLDAARAWIGLAESESPQGQQMFMYRETAKGRVRIEKMESPEADAAVAAGEYRQINLVVDGSTGMIMISY